MGRRGNNEGTIFRRPDGRWQAAITLPSGRKYYYGRTRADAARKLQKGFKSRLDGLPLPNERLTVGAYLISWLDTAQQLGSIRRSTLRNYRGYVKVHLIPGLGRLSLANLTAAQVQQFMADKLETGVPPRTVAYCRVVLRAALGKALKLGLVARNVATLTTPPNVPKREIKPLSPDEAVRFVEALKEDRLQALHVLMLALGLRQGEALGLTWRDVDLSNRVIHIRQGLSCIDGIFALEPLKTDRSRRTLALDDFLVATLQAHLDRQRLEERAATKWNNEWNLVFTAVGGQPLESRTVTRYFQAVLKGIGIERKRHYDLRHSAASLLIAQGADLMDVKTQLGHSTIALTADIYGHIFMERKRQLARGMGSFLSGAQRTPAADA